MGGVGIGKDLFSDAKTPLESGFIVHLAIFRSNLFPKQNLGKTLNSFPSLFGDKTLTCVLLSAVQTKNDASANCYGLSYYGEQMKQ